MSTCPIESGNNFILIRSNQDTEERKNPDIVLPDPEGYINTNKFKTIVKLAQKANIPLSLVENSTQSIFAEKPIPQSKEKSREFVPLNEIRDAIVFINRHHLLIADNVSEIFGFGRQATHYAGILKKLKEWDSSPEFVARMKTLLQNFKHVCGAVYGNMLSLGKQDDVLSYMPDWNSCLNKLSEAGINGLEEQLYQAWMIVQASKRGTKFRHDRWPSISWTLAVMANHKYLNQDTAESLLKHSTIDLIVQLFYYSETVSFENFKLAISHPDLNSIVQEVRDRKKVILACSGPGTLDPCSENELTKILNKKSIIFATKTCGSE